MIELDFAQILVEFWQDNTGKTEVIMRFRPCIDIHNGSVKQIVGGSLKDQADSAKEELVSENFVSELGGDFYADLYKSKGLKGGHIIILNPAGSQHYEADVRQAELALKAYPGGLQIGGGINSHNAAGFLDMGASHVIVTSYVFKDGRINYENLKELSREVGRDRLVIDLSCRKRDKDGNKDYYVVTDRWQKFTDVRLDAETLDMFSEYCDEFLIHAVDVEGMAKGIEEELAAMLGNWSKIPMTYAGGVGAFSDLEKLKALGRGNLDVTVGSALDIFGGNMIFEEVISFCNT